jgi:hypothetical protein
MSAADPDPTPSILAFLASIGIPTRAERLSQTTLLKGMAIIGGVIVYDPECEFAAGDLLHEAGHIAVASPEERLADPFESNGGDEMAAIAWSWAAAQHIGVPPDILFHANGYKGDGAWLIETFSDGNFIGLPLLQLYGMTIEPKQAIPGGPEAYPHMLRWVR